MMAARSRLVSRDVVPTGVVVIDREDDAGKVERPKNGMFDVRLSLVGCMTRKSILRSSGVILCCSSSSSERSEVTSCYHGCAVVCRRSMQTLP